MNNQDFQQLKQILRENGYHKNGDLWGTAISLFFDIAALAFEVDAGAPEWQYRPGAGGNVIEDNNAFLYYELSAAQCTTYGNYLNRLTDFLRYKGLDY